MGIGNSKGKKINVPNGYKLVRMISYNINLRNSVGLNSNIIDIAKFVFEDNIDIICLQGIRDSHAMMNLIKGIKTYCKKMDITIYTAPRFDNIEAMTIATTIHMPTTNITTTRGEKYVVESLIISRYEIDSYSTVDTTPHDMYKQYRMISANIVIDKTIISIYNTSLSDDIGTIDSSKRRLIEQEVMIDLILNNMINDRCIHIMAGSLGINEMEKEQQCDEYIKFLDKFRAIDLIRCKEPDAKILTTENYKRLDYILFFLTKDLFEKSSKYYNELSKVSSPNDMLSLIGKRYKLFILDMIVHSDIDISKHKPIEIKLMIKTK